MNMEIIREAGSILKKGGLVAFPTETVYGLGANALDEKAAAKTYAAKGRPSDNPLIVHIARLEDLYEVAEHVPEKAETLARKFWPGPLTMIDPAQQFPDNSVFLLTASPISSHMFILFSCRILS